MVPENLKENNYQLKDSFTWTVGGLVQGGRRPHSAAARFFQAQNPRGDFTFDQQFTENINDTKTDPGSALASFLVGNPIYFSGMVSAGRLG